MDDRTDSDLRSPRRQDFWASLVLIGASLFFLWRSSPMPFAGARRGGVGAIHGGMFDESLRRTLFLSDGDLSVLVTRPGAAILLGLCPALILSQLPPVRRGFKRLLSRTPA